MTAPGRRAVFLDRDGVITEPVLNPATGEFESPHDLGDVRFTEDAPAALRRLQRAGFELFIVSNQPSPAKGKAALGIIEAIAGVVDSRLRECGVDLRESFYCFHHPEGKIRELSGVCACRKPEPYFLRLAAERYGIDLDRSWMVGDRDTDVECGKRAGCRTILLEQPVSRGYQGASDPDYRARDLAEAVDLLMQHAEIA